MQRDRIDYKDIFYSKSIIFRSLKCFQGLLHNYHFLSSYPHHHLDPHIRQSRLVYIFFLNQITFSRFTFSHFGNILTRVIQLSKFVHVFISKSILIPNLSFILLFIPIIFISIQNKNWQLHHNIGIQLSSLIGNRITKTVLMLLDYVIFSFQRI